MSKNCFNENASPKMLFTVFTQHLCHQPDWESSHFTTGVSVAKGQTPGLIKSFELAKI